MKLKCMKSNPIAKTIRSCNVEVITYKFQSASDSTLYIVPLSYTGDETRRDLSSVDSLDGICASTGAPSTDDDTISLYSDFDSGTKGQKLETRIGINHFNRYACDSVSELSLLCLNVTFLSVNLITLEEPLSIQIS